MQTIEKLLKDLYKADPDLKAHEKELREILRVMLENKPDIKASAAFVKILKRQLNLRAEALSETVEAPHRFNWLNRLVFALSGAAVTALAFVAVTHFNPMSQPAIFSNQIQTVDRDTFELGASSDSASEGAMAPEAGAKAYGLGGGGMPSTTADAKMMVVPEELVNYHFVYKGELPMPTEAEMAVLKRTPATVSDKRLTEAVTGFDFGLADINKFSNLKMDYLSVTEDKKYGYTVQVNFTEGVINVGQNWPKWPNHDANCEGDSCQLKETDLLGDDELIAIADGFLKDHAINLEGYGQPVVMEDWLLRSPAAETMPAYIPDQIRVVYPEVIDGTVVTESDGNDSGLILTVSVRDKKVSSLNNLRANHYEKSLYAVEENSAKILDWASRGGIFFYAYRGAEKTVEVELETPELVFFRHFKWVPEENRTDEYLVPAYVFTITPDPSLSIFRSRIVVPAVKGFDELMMDQPEAVPLMAQ